MAKSRKKRQLQKRNKQDARKLIIIGLVIMLIFMLLGYFTFMRNV